jgi:lipopolysaccharide transport system ATP-binding protein
MTQPAIRSKGISKQYRIGQRERSLSLRDALASAAQAPFRRIGRILAGSNGQPSNTSATIWALKDVSFEIQHGEVVGIIGRNGAGKSTLLKVLSRITEPTEGRVEIHGRVGSLLEVGTGFHPELTGRENIFLNGAILGMRKQEIARKFDEIVAFAEVEKFIDTPVKHYSSGMYVRLAFAVAAHLDTEILLVDEVLAVGDFKFQKKCLGKMGDVSHSGRTIIFVSHNLAAIASLCPRVAHISEGQIRAYGATESVLQGYLSDVGSISEVQTLEDRVQRVGDGRIRFTSLHFEASDGSVTPVLRSGEDYNLVLGYACPDGREKRNVMVSFAIKDHLGTVLIHHRSRFSNQNFEVIPARGTFVCRIPELPLAEGEYSISIFVGFSNEEACDLVEDAARFSIEGGDFFGTGQQVPASFCRVLTKCNWEFRTTSATEEAEVAR